MRACAGFVRTPSDAFCLAENTKAPNAGKKKEY